MWGRNKEGVARSSATTGQRGADNLLGQRDPPPLPAPTRGGGGANGDGSVHHATACLADVARLENAWVEAYHAEDARVATVGELAALNPDCLPGTRIVFHPAARLLRFATPAASVWASAQNSDQPIALNRRDAARTRSSRVPTATSACASCRRLAHDFALRLREGATLIEAVTALDDPAFDFGTHLVGLVESGAVASIIPGQAS